METKSQWFSLIEVWDPTDGKKRIMRVKTTELEHICKFLRAKKVRYSVSSTSEESVWVELSEADEAWVITQQL